MASVIPTLRYRDADAALRWLVDVLGMAEHAVYRGDDGTITHAQLKWGSGYVMFGSAGEGAFGSTAPAVTYLVESDPSAIDAGHLRAVEASADVVMPPTDQDYGSREYAVRDPEGNIWSIGTYDPATAEH